MEVKKKFEGIHSELTSTILGAFFQIQAEFHRKISDNSRKGSLTWTKNP